MLSVDRVSARALPRLLSACQHPATGRASSARRSSAHQRGQRGQRGISDLLWMRALWARGLASAPSTASLGELRRSAPRPISDRSPLTHSAVSLSAPVPRILIAAARQNPAAMTRSHAAPPPPSQLPPAPTAAAAAAQPSTDTAATSASATTVPHGVRLSYFRVGAVDHLVAGLAAGTVSTLCLHPFDLLKTRLQVGGPGAALVGVPAAEVVPYRSSLHAARSLVANEGWAAMYKGITPNLVGNTVAWGLYFCGFDLVKRALSERQPLALVRLVSSPSSLPVAAADGSVAGSRGRRRQLNALEHILAASLTGTCVSALTNPIWVVKTRMFLDHTPSNNSAAAAAAAMRAASSSSSSSATAAAAPSMPSYSGLISALRSIYRTEGVMGLYRGFVPGLFGVSHGALQFMAYEELKKLRTEQRRQKSTLAGGGSGATAPVHWSAAETITMSILSKAFASLATYPYQVIRSRMQASHGEHVSLRGVLRATWREEGLRGFYRGVCINVVKVMPAACTVFLVYEQVGGYMKRHATYQQS